MADFPLATLGGDLDNCDSTPINSVARALLLELGIHKRTIVFAESCTAGLVASAVADIPGASEVLWGSFVCYTESAKKTMLGVRAATLEDHGAVSAETIDEMVRGARERSGSDYSAAVSGYAGPTAPSSELSPGRVVFAWIGKESPLVIEEHKFSGDRSAVRLKAAIVLLSGALRMARKDRGYLPHAKHH